MTVSSGNALLFLAAKGRDEDRLVIDPASNAHSAACDEMGTAHE